jgi:hypothetical protein
MKPPRNTVIHSSAQEDMTSDVEADRRSRGRISLADGEDDRWLADRKDSGWVV